MRFLSVCSGIEAASAAWRPLGWEAAAFSEIEPFPCSVLAHHYPTVPNWGDMTKYQEWPSVAIDLLCGGTPCQSFSVAGLRKGLDDPRGNLMLTFGAIAAKYRPRWLVWENVPGVLSSNGGRDFGAFLGMLGQLGYGFAYRVLDAQFCGVPQRRRRVFVVGCLGDWRSAAAVLFERHSLSGHPAPRREAGKAAPTIPSRSTAGGGLGTDFDCDGGLIHALQGNMLNRADHAGPAGPAGSGINSDGVSFTLTKTDVHAVAMCLNAGGGRRLDAESETLIPTIGGGFDVAHALTGEGFDASEDGTGRATPLVPIAFGWQNSSSQGASASDQHSPTLDKSKTPAVALALRGREGGATAELGDEVGNALRASSGGGDKAHVLAAMQVRRLTPRECERLQGFPDDYTAVPHRGKPAADGPRYKALGNSWAVPCARWIGERIQAVEAIHAQESPCAA